ncbi:MAG TPA: NUDIX domain-containing protein [Candidatus Paceibacterota bacterium]|nr:NUDIX domain-containing protein [Candidatus Pacearchaeota archaeon]HRZ50918.1 NUDIX domain-containing protein [Candidatus Paceibacterota bacterium]HSA36639.1 NUDIX domain-containing protein [Candidatus Paceibacterota bacterium]
MTRNLALIILLDGQKKFLLQLRDKSADIALGLWAFFGGGIESGETPELALFREIKEELDYVPKNPKLFLTQDYVYGGNSGTKYVFIDQYDPSQKLQQHEGESMGWFSQKDAEKLDMAGYDKAIIEKLAKKINANLD